MTQRKKPKAPPAPKETRVEPAPQPEKAVDTEDDVSIDYNRLRTITSVLQLDTINLIESSMASFSDARAVRGGALLEYSLQLADAAWARNGQQVDVVVGYHVDARIKNGEQGIDLFKVSVRFLVGYKVPESFELHESTKADVMADLVVANGQINVFPYVRQFVADQTARGGWPPLQLEVLRAPARRRRDFVREISQTAILKQD